MIADAVRGAEIATDQMREFSARDLDSETNRVKRARDYALWRVGR